MDVEEPAVLPSGAGVVPQISGNSSGEESSSGGERQAQLLLSTPGCCARKTPGPVKLSSSEFGGQMKARTRVHNSLGVDLNLTSNPEFTSDPYKLLSLSLFSHL